MFGAVMTSLQSYVIEKLGLDVWKSLLTEAGLPPDTVYYTARFYHDDELSNLVNALKIKTGLSTESIYRKVGKNFGKLLINTYSMMFFPDWKSLDVIENAAPKVFKSIQSIDPETPKSYVTCTRLSPNEIVIHYSSPRKMCAYILGIIDAVAEYFNENVEVTHVQCMYKGSLECEIHVKLLQIQPTNF